MNQRLLRTAFYTSLATYVVLLLLDYKWPGFVSYVFSVHLLLLPLLVSGTLYAFTKPQKTEHNLVYWLTIISGVGLAVIVWRVGTSFGEFRWLLSLVILFLPLWTVSFVK